MSKNRKKLLISFLYGILSLFIFLFINDLYFKNKFEEARAEEIKEKAQILGNYIVSSQKKDSSNKICNFYSSAISSEFSLNNSHGITLKNILNYSKNNKIEITSYEQDAINFFLKNSSDDDYFKKINSNDNKYIYALALRTKEACLECHSSKSDKNNILLEMGEISGIISITMPEKLISDFEDTFIQKELVYLIVIGILVLILISISYNNSYYIPLQENKDDFRDSLTTLNNRHFFNLLDESYFKNKSYYVIFLSVDHFKEVNSKFGHLCGDFVLKEFSSILESNTNNGDFLCRVSGRKFAMIVFTKNETLLVEKLEKIRLSVMLNNFMYEGNKVHITTSIGYAKSVKKISFTHILSKAQEALYLAKQAGNNRIEKELV